MKRLLVLLSLLALVLPVAAQDMGSCMIEPPESAAQVNMIGWTYPIIDFYADELKACNAVDNIDVNTQLLDSGSAHDQLRLALGAGGTSPYDIIMVTEGDVESYVHEGWMMPLNDLVDKYQEAYNISDISGLEDNDGGRHSLRLADGAEYAPPVLPPRLA